MNTWQLIRKWRRNLFFDEIETGFALEDLREQGNWTLILVIPLGIIYVVVTIISLIITNRRCPDSVYIGWLAYGRSLVIDSQNNYFFVDIWGRRINGQVFTEAYAFTQGFAWVRDKDGRYYHIQPNGQPAYQGTFIWVNSFSDGRCLVKDDDGLCYHIDGNGQAIYSERYPDGSSFSEGFAWMKVSQEGEDKQYIVIDSNGRPVRPEIFRFHTDFCGGRCGPVTVDGRKDDLIITPEGKIEFVPRQW